MQAEKEFSSCESQEQKIRSFIESQNNWQIAKIYSDAGYTGANTNRPALQELLEDIKQNKIDVILVYKIDRFTRSPKDFYQLIEVFDKFNISFISVTERFDTSTPAGRLLRNIMLTFAQFERELTSERTKDKMFVGAKKIVTKYDIWHILKEAYGEIINPKRNS
jgi:DNA invertase Pin-like site-specific DNA recombinase